MNNKLFIYLLFFLLCLENIGISLENKIIFKLDNQSFTTVDYEKRKNYLQFVGNNSNLSDKEILDDFISAIVFNTFFEKSNSSLDFTIKINEIYEEILKANFQNSNFKEKILRKNNIFNHLKIVFIRKSILENT